MEFENTFDVAAPIEEVWSTLLDVERVAPCVPGAEVLERVGDDAYKVAIKVRVGPMSMQYRGDIEIVGTDPATHTANMRARARETRGQGNADADVRIELREEGGRTHGTIHTQVQLSGRVAAMGRGIIADVSGKIVDQFSENLAAMLAGGGAGAAAAAPEGAPGVVPEGAPTGGPAAAPAGAPGVVPEGAPTGGPAAAPAGVVPEGAPTGAAPSGGAAGTPPRPAPAPSPGAELSALSLAGAVVKGRLKEPRTLAGVLGAVALLAFLLGRRR
jgi:carbon monoxide dehydrogenase subunit G